MKNEINQTAHSTYRCEYHIVFAPKYWRQIVYGQIKKDIGEIIRKPCREKNVEIIEAEACPNHIHMLVSVPPYLSIAQFVGFLKSKSALMIFDRHANLRYKYGNRSFWGRGYLCWYRREKWAGNKRIHKESTAKRQYGRPNQHERIYRPVYG